MSLRESLNKIPQSVSLGLLAVVLVALGIWFWSGFSNAGLTGLGKMYCTTDDGKTFFLADSSNIPPFTHDGKTAVQAMVFTADGGKTKFVGYLMQFTERGQERIRENRKQAGNARPGLDPELASNTQIKKPGEKNWISLSDTAAAARITLVSAPENSARLAEPVDPQ